MQRQATPKFFSAAGKHMRKKRDRLKNFCIDYYPYGMPMPGRSVYSNYRYGFQGEFAETDSETAMPAFELRIYDPRLGRWLNPDPMGQYHSPYMAMDNTPQMSVDPTGGCTVGSDCPDEFNWMQAGTTVLDEFIGTPDGSFGGVNWFSDSITGGGLLDFSTAAQGVWEEIQSKFGSIPYVINRNFEFRKFGDGSTPSGWSKAPSTSKPKANGGSETIYGELSANAYVSYSQGNFVLDVEGASLSQNHPNNKMSAFLNVKYTSDTSLRLATKSIKFERKQPLPLVPNKVVYLGSANLALPSNSGELRGLNFEIGHYRETPGGAPVSHNLRENLLKIIVNK